VHELSLSTAILDTVLRHAEGRPVSAVRMRVGTLRQVVPDSLGFYFGIVARETLCAGATLEQEVVAARLRCRGCGGEWEPDPELPLFRCPRCDDGAVEVVAGEELEIESIEVDEAEEGACTGPR
jgi:hydrogenase nickel incorporation protein HypA/HybF